MTSPNAYPAALKQTLKPLPVAGLGAVALSLLVLLFAGRQAMTGWLIAATFWCGVPVGALAWVMVHHLTGGKWGVLTRPSLEAMAATVPLNVLLILPPLVFCGLTYPWGNAAMIADHPVLQHQQLYMWPPLVWARLLLYAVLASGFALVFWRVRRPMTHLAAPGLILVGVLSGFASLDFLMTRTLGYVSSVFGFIVVVGWAYSAWSLAVLAHANDEAVDDEQRNHLGSLLATMALLWLYVSIAQFIISWIGNKLPESHWYVLRGLAGEAPGPWRWVGLLVFLVAFAVPFGAMLFKTIKRDPRRLRIVAGVALAGRLLDGLWLAGPSDMAGGFGVWSVLVALLVLGGFGVFWWPLWTALTAATPAVTQGESSSHEKAASHVTAQG